MSSHREIRAAPEPNLAPATTGPKTDEAKLEALTRAAEALAPVDTGAAVSTAASPAQPAPAADLAQANEKLSSLLGKPK